MYAIFVSVLGTNKFPRWQYRFVNYKNALEELRKALSQQFHSDLERDGTIQRFEFTLELAWNLLQDYLIDTGYQGLKGPKNILVEAFSLGYIRDGNVWMDMLKDRHKTSHTYDEVDSIVIFNKIKTVYVQRLDELEKFFDKLVK